MHSATRKEQFILLRSQGLSLQTISGKLGVARSTLQRWNEELVEKIRDEYGDQIAIAVESAAATKIRRAEALGTGFRRVADYLAKSDDFQKDARLYTLLLNLEKHMSTDLVRQGGPIPYEVIVAPPPVRMTGLGIPRPDYDAPDENDEFDQSGGNP